MQESKYIEELLDVIDEDAFVDPDETNMVANPAKTIKIAILSKTTNVFLNRNNSNDAVTAHEVNDKMRAYVPAQKWKGAEQSKAIKMARELDLLPPEYSQNQIAGSRGLINPVSALFGDTVTASDGKGQIRGRINYGWSHSIEPLAEVTKKVQHNTLQEDGTILKDDEGNTKPEAIHSTKYILPGVDFVRFITLENVPPQLFVFYLCALKNTHRYGGRTSITGDNMQNKIIAIGYGMYEAPITNYTVLKDIDGKNVDPSEYVEKAMEEYYEDKCLSEKALEKINDIVKNMMQDEKEMKNMLEPISEWVEESFPEYF